MQKIIPNLWYDTEAEEAANFYVSLFKNSKILGISRYTDAAKEVTTKPAGSVMTVTFELDGQQFTAINGGPDFKFTEAVSLQIQCETQEEVDRLWSKLCEGGEEGPCGWLKDRYGLSWQVTPTALEEMLSDPDTEKSERAMKAMLQMKKLDVNELRRAFEGVTV